MFNITPIIQCVICVLVILGSAYGLPFLKEMKWMRYVKMAVKAAEQMFRGSGRGDEKKKYVLEWLNKRGITYDEDKVLAMLESAVFDLNQEALQIEAMASTGLILNENYDYGKTEGGTDETMGEPVEKPAAEPAHSSFSVVFPETVPAEDAADPVDGEAAPAQ